MCLVLEERHRCVKLAEEDMRGNTDIKQEGVHHANVCTGCREVEWIFRTHLIGVRNIVIIYNIQQPSQQLVIV